MSYMNPHYEELALNVLKGIVTSTTGLVLRQINIPDYSTEISNEVGTTDMAIGDVTAEVMITTLGKIPNEMFYLEDTTPNIHSSVSITDSHVMTDTASSTISPTTPQGLTTHSVVLLILTIAFIILMFLCCLTACMISKTKRRNHFFDKSDIECDPDCPGINRPLLSSEKNSDSTSKTSCCSIKN